MNIRRAFVVPSLLVGFLFALVWPGTSANAANKQDDISAIYSELLHSAGLKALGRNQNQCWAIADTTINIDDMNPALAPDAQLKPPGYDPKPFQEALTDFNARKYQRENLAHSVQVGSSYPMLSQQEVAEFRASRSSATASNSSGTRYSGCAGVSYFSDVYFSARHTAALVYMLNWCGSLCSQGEWIYVEKVSDHWVQRSGQAGIVSGARPF